ncbi:MAG: N4-gp56 family major capsid protein [Oscillospiraceae bacterium]|nr:N4-gp56 family major capsid protein [Oscillospiraceae bacterium]
MDNRNLASKYAKKVDERFSRESQAMLALNSDYSFTGVRTVNVYSIPTVAMSDYQRSGDHRYGIPNDLSRNVQTMTVGRDRAFTFIIDKGDKTQSQMVMDAGKALGRQLKEVWVPEFDSYVFRKLAAEATARGNCSTEEITKENAYEMFLAAMESLGNKNVPDKGRVAFCSYKFANYLKQDPAFIKTGDSSQEMLIRGVIGEVDGCRIVKVPSSRLPSGCAFLLTHPLAATAPKQLEEYKTHADPPGISGFLVEGRVVYDCFVLAEKADAIYYHGEQKVLRDLNVTATETGDGKAVVLINPGVPEDGCSWYYKTGEKPEALAYDGDVSGWDALGGSGSEIAVEGESCITVAEAGADGKAKAVGFVKV